MPITRGKPGLTEQRKRKEYARIRAINARLGLGLSMVLDVAQTEIRPVHYLNPLNPSVSFSYNETYAGYHPINPNNVNVPNNVPNNVPKNLYKLQLEKEHENPDKDNCAICYENKAVSDLSCCKNSLCCLCFDKLGNQIKSCPFCRSQIK
jgi:hypothetical protein